MKMSKRIFIVLLTFAVLVSSFALYAFADSEPVSGVNCDGLLAYYEEEAIFNYDFGEGNVDYAESVMLENPTRITQGFISDAAAPGGGYLEFAIGNTPPKNIKSFYFNWNSETGVDSFYFDTTVSADKVGNNYPKLRLVIDGDVFTAVSSGNTVGANILTLDFQNGVITYISGVEEDAYVTADVEYALTLGAWYTVSFDYDFAKGSAVAVVTNVADAADTVTVSDVYLPFEAVKNVRFGVHKNASDGTVLKFASISAATGTNRFNLSDKQQGLEDAILEIYSSYTSPEISIDDKLLICDAVDNVLGYGFVTDNAEVNVAINDIKLGSINLYANALRDALSKLGTLDNYDSKRAAVDIALEYVAILEDTDLSPVAPEDLAVINSNMQAAYDADELLNDVEADSLAFIELFTGAEADAKSEDYSLLTGYCDAVVVLDVDVTYDGVADVYVIYTAMLDKMDDIKYEADCFMADLDHLANTERDFMDRYYHYLEFKDNVYTNETYPGITEALAKYNNVVLPDILANIDYAEKYVTHIERANFASYISAKEENIKIADQYAELCHPDFPGVKEAKELRLEVLEYIEAQKALAQAYIDAVKALSSLSGNELTKGIENAQKLQKTGNVLGVDGVTEANMTLNQIISDINLKTRYSEYFITLVDSLNYVYKAEEMYDIIIEALHAEKKADQTYPGVSEASVDLEAAIEDYNYRVSYCNDEFATANLAAADTVGIGETANSVADNVIAIVQTVVYEDDEEDEE